MSRQIIAPIAAGVLLAMVGAAQAATKTASFNVTASVGRNCVIGATPLALGEFVGDNDLQVNSSILVRCTAGTAYDIALSTGGSGDYTAREMAFGTDVLVYNLYTDGTFGDVWGDGSGATNTVGGLGAGMAIGSQVSHPVVGRLLASDNTGAISAGLGYTDTIVATITY
jgi:spore coat protein U-like protein